MACFLPLIDKNTHTYRRSHTHTHTFEHTVLNRGVLTKSSSSQWVASHRAQSWVFPNFEFVGIINDNF